MNRTERKEVKEEYDDLEEYDDFMKRKLHYASKLTEMLLDKKRFYMKHNSKLVVTFYNSFYACYQLKEVKVQLYRVCADMKMEGKYLEECIKVIEEFMEWVKKEEKESKIGQLNEMQQARLNLMFFVEKEGILNNYRNFETIMNEFKEDITRQFNDIDNAEIFCLLIDEMIPSFLDDRLRQAFNMLHTFNKVLYEYNTTNFSQFVNIERLMSKLYSQLRNKEFEI